MSLLLDVPLAKPAADAATQVVSHGPAFLCGRPLGEILRHTSGLTEDKLQEALQIQAEKGGRLGEVLVGMKAISEEDVAKALGLQLDAGELREATQAQFQNVVRLGLGQVKGRHEALARALRVIGGPNDRDDVIDV